MDATAEPRSTYAHLDDVNGHVVGDCCWTGRVYYDGRPDGQQLFADTEDDLHAQANRLFADRRAECGEVFRLIYPADAWELRIFGA